MIAKEKCLFFNEDIDMSNPYFFKSLTTTNLTKVNNISELSKGKWCWNEDDKCYVISPTITTNYTRGYIKVYDKSFTVCGGDIIEIEYEISNSGFTTDINAGVSIDIMKEDDTSLLFSPKFVHTKNTNGFVPIRKKYKVPLGVGFDKTTRLIIGVVTSDANTNDCLVKIRNVKFTLIKENSKIENYKKTEFKKFQIKKSDGVFSIRTDFESDGGAITEVNENELQLTYDTPFNSTFRPIAFASSEYVGVSKKIRVTCAYSQKNFVKIAFLDATNNYIPLANVSNDTNFSILVVG